MKPKIVTFSVALLIGVAMGNGLTISNLSVNQTAGTVTFDVQWHNSFRDAENWDAVWIFVKFRDCSVPKTVPFTHGLISTTLSDHTFPATLQPTCANGTPNCIDPAPDNTGVMLRRTSNGFGTIGGTVTLRVTNLPAAGSYDVRVIGIEMVFIPQGSFYAGDATSNNSIRTSNTDNSPIQITSEAALTTISYLGAGNFSLTANFRKGFAAFYIMKYEISHGQYVDFLNTIGQSQASNRFPNTTVNRHRVMYNTLTTEYYTDRPDRAVNYISWEDLVAYLDWAALRPLTELEYEKACRGPLAPVPNEFAWGTTAHTYGVTLSGAEDGTETFITPGANARAIDQTITGGDGGAGPCRVGIFATPSTNTRAASGASYWGVMNLSDNVLEYYYDLRAGQSGRSPSNGIPWGDGNLSAAGDANQLNWVTTCNTTDIIMRGVMQAGNPNLGRVSHRGFVGYTCGWSDYYPGRFFTNGGRGGR
ncbi:MAG: SUMF1/EgtB/PvdO family nonheme iron enzyme [Bacteroidia bacterium]|nr:SUMF1/EgtB/PvdO family nonheme iron enzyme [Bacteroidia bacterium]MDW8417211.1 SUMF1/EgtB/PvdO family nonheme iron enzyme [Bacteroidia bacterium]